MTAFVAGACALVGLAVGAFLNVVIHRVPRREPVVQRPSACPACGAAIANRDSIPVISWLMLGGRCRTCGEPISVRYVLVELGTAVAFVGAAVRFGAGWALPPYLVFLAGLLALAVTDVEHRLLPVRIVYPVLGLLAGLLVLAAAADGHWSRLATAAATGAVAFGCFFAINLLNSGWMAFGDVRLAGVIGVGLGWLGAAVALMGFFLAFLLGSVVGVVLILSGRIDRKTKIPFGVFLAIGAYIAVFAGRPLVDLYLRR